MGGDEAGVCGGGQWGQEGGVGTDSGAQPLPLDPEPAQDLGPFHPDLSVPRGTNPFATVKLRPTVTNDRSAPLIR